MMNIFDSVGVWRNPGVPTTPTNAQQRPNQQQRQRQAAANLQPIRSHEYRHTNPATGAAGGAAGVAAGGATGGAAGGAARAPRPTARVDLFEFVRLQQEKKREEAAQRKQAYLDAAAAAAATKNPKKSVAATSEPPPAEPQTKSISIMRRPTQDVSSPSAATATLPTSSRADDSAYHSGASATSGSGSASPVPAQAPIGYEKSARLLAPCVVPFVTMRPQQTLPSYVGLCHSESGDLLFRLRNTPFPQVAEYMKKAIIRHHVQVRWQGRPGRLYAKTTNLNCLGCERPAQKQCSTCNVAMCTDCCVRFHDQTHSIVDLIDPRSKPKRSMEHCALHYGGFGIVCLECCVVACSICDAHKGHNIRTIDNFLLEARHHLNQTLVASSIGVLMLRQSLHRTDSIVSALEQSYRNLKRLCPQVNADGTIDYVHFNDIMQKANDYHKLAVDYITLHALMLTDALQNQVAENAELEALVSRSEWPAQRPLDLTVTLLEYQRSCSVFTQALSVPLYPVTLGFRMDHQIGGSKCKLVTYHSPSRIASYTPGGPTHNLRPAANPFHAYQSAHNVSFEGAATDMPSQAVFGLSSRLSVQLRANVLQSFACEGKFDGDVNRPWGVCVNSLGNVIVADRRNHRIQVYTQGGMLVRQFGSFGRQLGQFDLPCGVCVDKMSNIYVADKDNHRVQVFSQLGEFRGSIGSPGTGDGQFSYPWDVAVNGRFELAVTDSRNSRVQLFNSNGQFSAQIDLNAFRVPQSVSKNNSMPRGVCWTPTGLLLVTDFEYNRVYRIGRELKTVDCILEPGENEFLCLNRPSGICCDDEGRMIVADSKNSRLMVYAANGNFLCSVNVPSTNIFGNYEGMSQQSDRLCDVAILPNGHLVVVAETAPERQHMAKFHKTKTFVRVF